MSTEVTVGIDIGTSSVKAIAADDDGAVVARARVPHSFRVPTPGRFEHDASAAWRAGPRAALAAIEAEVATLEDALLCHADVLSYPVFGCGPEFEALTQRVWDRRGFGDFWGHMLVAEGIADVMVEPVLNVWDVAAVIPIVAEAGGRCTDRRGVVRADGGNAVTTNGLLHDAVLEVMGDHS